MNAAGQPCEQQLSRDPPQRVGVLNDRRRRGIKQVCEREVIEADEGDPVLKLTLS